MDNFSFSKFDFSKITTPLGHSKGRLEKEDQEVAEAILAIFSTIQRNMDYWDERCWFTKKKYGKHLLNSIAYIDAPDFRLGIHGVILSIYAFYIECRYWSNDYVFDTSDPGIYFRELISTMQRSDFYSGLISKFSDLEAEVYRETIRARVNNETFQKLYDEVNDRENILNRVSNLNTYLDSKTQLIEALDEKISKLRTEYNFIGLYKGFQDVSKKKEINRKDALKFTYMLGGALISVPFLVIILGLIMQYMGLLNLTLLQFLAIPVISAEVFLFYYFRLKYLEVKSFDAQLLQLDVRMSLCQFVEAYSKFATEIHKESPGLLSNFETLVFSPIVAKESDIPPLIDGANQITDLISKIRR